MEQTQPNGIPVAGEELSSSEKSRESAPSDAGRDGQTGASSPDSNGRTQTSRDDLGRAKEVELAREATRKAIEQGNFIPAQQPAGSTDGNGKEPGTRILGRISGVSSMNAGETAAPKAPVEITLRTLLEAGAHFGHQTSRWNPAMSPYIYGSRNGIHIINLPKTVQAWNRAKSAIEEMAAQGGSFLFVGTKKQAQESVGEEAKRCNGFYVAERWLGGMLTNFSTVRKSVDRMKKLEEILQEEEERQNSGASFKFTKKERLMFARELEKLVSSIGGIRDMTSLPSMLFVIDIRREEIAVKEARRLDIPVVALVDTNCDPAAVPYAIPSNDDGTRAIRLFAQAVADTVLEGRKRYVPRPADERTQNYDRRDDRRDASPRNRNRRPRNEGPRIEGEKAAPAPAAAAAEEGSEAQGTPAEA